MDNMLEFLIAAQLIAGLYGLYEQSGLMTERQH